MQFDPVGVVNQPVEDSVSEGGVGKDAVPGRDRELRGDQGSRLAIPVVCDFQQVATLDDIQRRQPKVIKDEQIRFFNFSQQFDPGSFIPRRQQVIQQAAHPEVFHFESLPAGGIAEGGGQPGLAGTASPCDKQVAAFLHPRTVGQPGHLRPVYLADGVIVNILQAGFRVAQRGRLSQPGQLVVLPGQPLGVHQHGQPFLERQFPHGGQFGLTPQFLFHHRQTHGGELLQRLIQHCPTPVT